MKDRYRYNWKTNRWDRLYIFINPTYENTISPVLLNKGYKLLTPCII